jgi:hypothetical protein
MGLDFKKIENITFCGLFSPQISLINIEKYFFYSLMAFQQVFCKRERIMGFDFKKIENITFCGLFLPKI